MQHATEFHASRAEAAHRPGAMRAPRAARGRRAGLALALLALVVLPALPGCTSGEYRYRFQPLPAVVQVHTSQGTSDLLLVSVLGAIRPEGGEGDEVHLRFRLQNATQQVLRLPVGKQHLLAGDLLDFPPARLIAGSAEVAPGQSALADLAFPMPDGGSADVRGLTLGWVLEVEGTELSGTLTFQRVVPETLRDPYGPYGPYWGPYPPPYWGWGHDGWHHGH